jgi:hypothetical protein
MNMVGRWWQYLPTPPRFGGPCNFRTIQAPGELKAAETGQDYDHFGLHPFFFRHVWKEDTPRHALHQNGLAVLL